MIGPELELALQEQLKCQYAQYHLLYAMSIRCKDFLKDQLLLMMISIGYSLLKATIHQATFRQHVACNSCRQHIACKFASNDEA